MWISATFNNVALFMDIIIIPSNPEVLLAPKLNLILIHYRRTGFEHQRAKATPCL